MAELKPLTRLNYYNGQLLDAELLSLEQAYTANLIGYHNQALFTPGVLSGLQLEARGETAFTISQGLAIDDQGRQLVWPHGADALVLPDRDSNRVYVSLQWHESPLGDEGKSQQEYNQISLLPAVRYNDNSDDCLLIAVLTVVGGVITHVNNDVKDFVSLKIESKQRLRPEPTEQNVRPEPTALAGSAEHKVSLRPGDLVWKHVTYRDDGKPAFGLLPIVTVSAVSREMSVYALTLNGVTAVGFNVGITWQAGEKHDPDVDYSISIHWHASPPTPTDQSTGDAHEPTH